MRLVEYAWLRSFKSKNKVLIPLAHRPIRSIRFLVIYPCNRRTAVRLYDMSGKIGADCGLKCKTRNGSNLNSPGMKSVKRVESGENEWFRCYFLGSRRDRMCLIDFNLE